MAHILILGGGAAGLAAALAAAQTDPTTRVTVLERSPRPGKKLLATGNGRCNLDNEGITPESYSSADRAALDALLRTVNAPTHWAGSVRWAFTPAPMRPAGYTPTPIRPPTCWPCWSIIWPAAAWRCVPAALCRP